MNPVGYDAMKVAEGARRGEREKANVREGLGSSGLSVDLKSRASGNEKTEDWQSLPLEDPPLSNPNDGTSCTALIWKVAWKGGMVRT